MQPGGRTQLPNRILSHPGRTPSFPLPEGGHRRTVRLLSAGVVSLVLLTSACGSGSSGSGTTNSSRLSPAAYRSRLETIAGESNTAQHAVEQGFQAASVPRLVAVLTAFSTAEKRIGD